MLSALRINVGENEVVASRHKGNSTLLPPVTVNMGPE